MLILYCPNKDPLSRFIFFRQHLTIKTSPCLFPRHWETCPHLLQTVPSEMSGCSGGPYLALQGKLHGISSLRRLQTDHWPSGIPGRFPRLLLPRLRLPHHPPCPVKGLVLWETSEQVLGSSPTDTPCRWHCPLLSTHARIHPRTTAPPVWTTSWWAPRNKHWSAFWRNVFVAPTVKVLFS